MMKCSKKLLVLIFSGVFASHFSQSRRFIYEYQYISDSTHLEGKKTELMYLDVMPKFSKYYSGETFKNDSIAKEILDKQMKATLDVMPKFSKYYSGETFKNDSIAKEILDKQMKATGKIENMPQSAASKSNTIKYTVIKDYAENKQFFITRMGRTKYNVSDNRIIQWKVHPEKNKVKEYNVQKATADFGGRKWTAWFSADIPVQDGPYKFRGLPGMILKIQDATGSHSFTLAGIRKLSDQEIEKISPTGNFVFEFGDKVDIDFLKYKQLFLESRNDPTKSLRLTLHDMDKINVNGTMVEKGAYIREREMQMKQAIKEDNNNIEIDMLRK